MLPELSQVVAYGPTVIILLLLLIFAVRMAPTYKEIKLKEFDVRDREAAARQEQAASLSNLAAVIKDVAIEQQRATENNEEMKLVLRSAMRENETVSRRLTEIERTLDEMKGDRG